MFWWGDESINNIIVNQLFERAFSPYIKFVRKNCYAGDKRMDYWNFLNICEHQNTQNVTHAYNSWTDLTGKESPRRRKKAMRKTKRAISPTFILQDGGRIYFPSILFKIVLVNLSVFSKYMNLRSSLLDTAQQNPPEKKVVAEHFY